MGHPQADDARHCQPGKVQGRQCAQDRNHHRRPRQVRQDRQQHRRRGRHGEHGQRRYPGAPKPCAPRRMPRRQRLNRSTNAHIQYPDLKRETPRQPNVNLDAAIWCRKRRGSVNITHQPGRTSGGEHASDSRSAGSPALLDHPCPSSRLPCWLRQFLRSPDYAANRSSPLALLSHT